MRTGAVAHCTVQAPLPYALHFDVHVLDVVEGARVVTEVRGDLAGPARLTIAPAGAGCEARLRWELDLQAPLLRSLALVGRPLMAWAHDRIIEHGLDEFQQRDSRRPIADVVRDGRAPGRDVQPPPWRRRRGTSAPGAPARFCADLDVDLLGLQEVSRGRRHSLYVDQATVVARRTRARHVAGPAMTRGRWRRYGNALLVRGGV